MRYYIIRDENTDEVIAIWRGSGDLPSIHDFDSYEEFSNYAKSMEFKEIEVYEEILFSSY